MEKRLISGILLVDKPEGPTSHDIVEMVRYNLGVRRVGHMGTLDPLATGLLIVGVGEATKLAPFLSDLDKVYECTARLGGRSTTYDAMGTIEEVAGADVLPSADEIERTLADFRGEIEQLPPPFSAVKVRGRPMYDYARKGEAVERRPRRVRVHQIEIVRYEPPHLDLRMRVGSGTYVRSIVHDLGERLGVGAYVSRLRRTAVGPFDVERAVRVAPDGAIGEDPASRLIPLAEALAHWDRVALPAPLAEVVRNGGLISARNLKAPRRAFVADRLYALLDEEGRLVAVARCLINRGSLKVQGGGAARGDPVLKPVRVFRYE